MKGKTNTAHYSEVLDQHKLPEQLRCTLASMDTVRKRAVLPKNIPSAGFHDGGGVTLKPIRPG